MEEMIRSDSCVSFRSFGVFCSPCFTKAESRSIKELGVDVVIAGDGWSIWRMVPGDVIDIFWLWTMAHIIANMWLTIAHVTTQCTTVRCGSAMYCLIWMNASQWYWYSVNRWHHLWHSTSLPEQIQDAWSGIVQLDMLQCPCLWTTLVEWEAPAEQRASGLTGKMSKQDDSKVFQSTYVCYDPIWSQDSIRFHRVPFFSSVPKRFDPESCCAQDFCIED